MFAFYIRTTMPTADQLDRICALAGSLMDDEMQSIISDFRAIPEASVYQPMREEICKIIVDTLRIIGHENLRHGRMTELEYTNFVRTLNTIVG